jgi:hypothetical protein
MTISPPRPLALDQWDDPEFEPADLDATPPRGHRAGRRRVPGRLDYLTSAMLRCGLYLGPLSVVITAAGIGAGGLATLATVTAALVTRSETAVIRWSIPGWLLAASTLATALGDNWAVLLRTDPVPKGLVLLVVILVALVRAFLPAFARRVPSRPPLARAELRRAFGFLLIGAAQAVCLALLWRSGPSGASSVAAFPLLAAVPLVEALVAWHAWESSAGLDLSESRAEYQRHLRGVNTVTVTGLLSPLGVGAALAVAAYRLPYGVAPRDGVLALAAGTLLVGVFAATFLLAARGRTALAALLAIAPLPAIVIVPLLTAGFPDRLPLLVVVLTASHLAGLLTVAHTAADHRRSP